VATIYHFSESLISTLTKKCARHDWGAGPLAHLSTRLLIMMSATAAGVTGDSHDELA